MSDIGAHLDVVEVVPAHGGWYAYASAIPRHLVLGIVLMDVFCQVVDVGWIGISSHETNAGDVGAVVSDEAVDDIRCELLANVLPQVAAMATWAMARAVGDVDGERHLVRYFLKDDSRINVFHHQAWA